jgi:hypothetical protein
MAVPFVCFPTFGDFIAAAKAQGCNLKTLKGIVGPRGPAPAKYFVAPGPKGPIAILPSLADSERLAPDQIAGLVRVLKITGFDQYFLDENRVTHYDYHPDKPS